jgi:hypothetical protein
VARMFPLSFYRGGRQAHDFVPAERLEKRLKAATDQAAHGPAVDFDLGNPRRAPDLLGRRRADEAHFDSLHWELTRHTIRVGSQGRREIRGITDRGLREARRNSGA